MSKKPVTPEEQWSAIVGFARGEDDDRDTHATDAEIDADLAAHGYDVAKIHAGTQAFLDQTRQAIDALEAGATAAPKPAESGPSVSAPPGEPRVVSTAGASNVVPLAPRRRAPWTVMLLAAAIAVALTIGTATMIVRRDPVDVRPTGPEKSLLPPEKPQEPPPTEVAADARGEAKAACARKEWIVCSRRLDDAARLDPDGENDPAVQSMRAAIQTAAEEMDRRSKGK